MSAVRRRTPAATQRWRRAYLFGYSARVRELLAETRRRVEADSAARVGSILPDQVGRATQVHAFAATAFGRVVAASAPAAAVAGGWERGHREASSVDLGRARLAGRPELGPG
jgi:hypothetical protein